MKTFLGALGVDRWNEWAKGRIEEKLAQVTDEDKALANTILLKKAGIIKEDGTAGKTELRGGEITVDADGMPTGFLSEQAQTYVRSFLDNDNLYTLDRAISNLAEIEQYLLSVGYTMYHEGWGNYFVNTNYYQAAQQLDQAGKLHFVLGLPSDRDSRGQARCHLLRGQEGLLDVS